MYLPIVAAFLSVVIIFAIKWFLCQKRISKLINQIPGPPNHPIFGTLLSFFIPAEEIWRFMRATAITYYPIFKYWQFHSPKVNLVCPEDVEIVLSSMKHISKADMYDLLHPWLGTGLLTSTGKKWQERRKILTSAFHFNILQQFLKVFTEESELLVQELQQECNKPYTDITPFISQFTLNSVCETSMGTRLDKTDKHCKSYIDAIFRLAEILLYRLLRPWYNISFLFKLSPKHKEQKHFLNVLHTFSNSVIKNRRKEFKQPDITTKRKRLAMLDLLISAGIDDNGIREEVDTFMFEGHDTTAASICFTLLSLACHKDIQEKVIEELNEVFGESDRTPTYEDLQNLRYLDKVLKESLRMYPSVHFIARVAETDIHTHSGYIIPEKTSIYIQIYDLHHNPNIYPDPEKFDPERFSPENSQKRHPFAYLPFSAGPRNCIGQKYALLEIKTVISAILRKFHLEPVDTPSDMKMTMHFVLRTTSGIKIKFKQRK